MPWASFLPSDICRRGKERTKLDELKAALHKFGLRASCVQHSVDHGLGSEDEMGDIDEEVQMFWMSIMCVWGEVSGEEVQY